MNGKGIRFISRMERNERRFRNRYLSRLAGIALLSVLGFFPDSLTSAASSEEAAIKLVQSSSYNLITGNWDVVLGKVASEIVEDFKANLPELDYHLVEEDVTKKGGNERRVLVFRGVGDQRVVLKLKEFEGGTNVRLRVGLTGNEAKSAELFKYVYLRM